MMLGIIFLIIQIVVVVIAFYIGIRIFLWLFTFFDCSIHHYRFPDRQKLKRGILKSYLMINYGKAKGKDLFRQIRQELKKKGIK